MQTWRGMVTELSGESAVSLQNDQETAQLLYVPAHEESMYIDVFSHSKRTSAFDFGDEVKLQSFLYRKQANKHCGLLVHQAKVSLWRSYIQNIPFEVKGF